MATMGVSAISRLSNTGNQVVVAEGRNPVMATTVDSVVGAKEGRRGAGVLPMNSFSDKSAIATVGSVGTMPVKVLA